MKACLHITQAHSLQSVKSEWHRCSSWWTEIFFLRINVGLKLTEKGLSATIRAVLALQSAQSQSNAGNNWFRLGAGNPRCSLLKTITLTWAHRMGGRLLHVQTFSVHQGTRVSIKNPWLQNIQTHSGLGLSLTPNRKSQLTSVESQICCLHLRVS